MRLSGRTAIVTGAATGIGRAIAERYATEGAKVALLDVGDAGPAAVAIGGDAIALKADISSENEVAAAVAAVREAFGTVDILVNNAAIASIVRQAPLEQLTVEDWRRTINVNVIGTFLMCRAVAPSMRAQQRGRIINFSSGTALRGQPNILHYVASKGAVWSMTMALANELGGDNITVNAIAPGYILTEGNLANAQMGAVMREMVVQRRAIRREGVPEDIVGAALFLASDEASFVSSQMIAVNGGLP